MREYLVFRLYGPMAAWGDIAVGESRHSFSYPSKSSVMGMIGAALGIPREAEQVHQEIFRAYGFGGKVLSMGTLLRDYHTVQAPSEQRGVRYYTRRDELRFRTPGTLLSSREYRCDALNIVALWMISDTAPYSIEQLARALNRPRFVLYLGRKSCPLSLPVLAEAVQAESLRAALDREFPPIDNQGRLPLHSPQYYWDDTADAGMEPQYRIQRWDNSTSRKRWQFEARNENVRIEEADHVF
jgi:CRISPR system Cascade subunit CasD